MSQFTMPRRPYCNECPPTCDFPGDCPDRNPDSEARVKAIADAIENGRIEVLTGREAEAAIGAIPMVQLTQYSFDECSLDQFAGRVRGAGSDRLELVFTGRGSQDFRATFPDGRTAKKPCDGPWAMESLRFVPGVHLVNSDGSFPEEAPAPCEYLDLRDRDMDARVTVTDLIGMEQTPYCQIKVEMSVRRGGGGMVRPFTGDPLEDRQVLTPELLLTIGELCGPQGTLFIFRQAESKQGDLFGESDPYAAPEGQKERTLRRGTKKAVAVLETAIKATKPDGTEVSIDEVRSTYDADPAMHLRTWDGGPVKVLRDFTLVYVLELPAAEAGPEEEGEPASEGQSE